MVAIFAAGTVCRFPLGEGDTDSALAASPHTLSLVINFQRYYTAPMETCGYIAEWNHRGNRLTLHSNTQMSHPERSHLANTLGVPERAVRVINPRAGGGFGHKSSTKGCSSMLENPTPERSRVPDSPTLEFADGPRLKQNSIGVAGILLMVIACTAPLTAMASNFMLCLGFGAGVGTLGWIVAVGILLAAFTVGFVVLSRHVINAGAYYAYIGFGLGRATGSAAAFVATVAYNLACAAMIAATGYFANIAFATYLSIDLAWYVFSAAALVVVAALGYLGIDFSAKLTGTASVIQFILLGALAVAVVVQRPSGFTLGGFTPDAMFSGNYALAIAFCVLGFAGYEAAAIYGEESKAPRTSVKRATYAALGILVAVFLVSTWSVIAAFSDPVATVQADPGTALMHAADIYLGSWSGAVIVFSLAFTFLGSAVAFHNMAARYQFALGRSGLLPRRLGTVQPRRGTPYVSSLLQDGITLLILLPFALAGMDPLIDLIPAIAGVNSIALTFLMLACSISVIRGSVRGVVHGSALSTRWIPAATAVGLFAVIVVIALNYEQVTGSASGWIMLMPILPLVAAIYGAIRQRRTAAALIEDHLAT